MIVLGEALVDIAMGARQQHGEGLALNAHAGGSPANVAVGLARLGVPTRFAGRISRHGLGPFLRAHLEDSGVDLGLCVDASEPTTLAIVGVDRDGAASYSFYVEGTADWQWKPEELPPAEAGEVIHTGSLAIAVDPGAGVLTEWVLQRRALGDVFVSVDPNLRLALVSDRARYRERLETLVTAAHLVKVSDEDLHALDPDTEPLETALSWAGRGPELVVVTHGASGSTALRAGAEAVSCGTPTVSVVDTIGAGDAYTAGLLTFLAEHDRLHAGACRTLDRETLAAALRFASFVAAITCTRPGADPPGRAELDAALAAGTL